MWSLVECPACDVAVKRSEWESHKVTTEHSENVWAMEACKHPSERVDIAVALKNVDEAVKQVEVKAVEQGKEKAVSGYEDRVAQVLQTFPRADKGVVCEILESNGGDVAAAVMLLSGEEAAACRSPATLLAAEFPGIGKDTLRDLLRGAGSLEQARVILGGMCRVPSPPPPMPSSASRKPDKAQGRKRSPSPVPRCTPPAPEALPCKKGIEEELRVVQGLDFVVEATLEDGTLTLAFGDGVVHLVVLPDEYPRGEAVSLDGAPLRAGMSLSDIAAAVYSHNDDLPRENTQQSSPDEEFEDEMHPLIQEDLSGVADLIVDLHRKPELDLLEVSLRVPLSPGFDRMKALAMGIDIAHPLLIRFRVSLVSYTDSTTVPSVAVTQEDVGITMLATQVQKMLVAWLRRVFKVHVKHVDPGTAGRVGQGKGFIERLMNMGMSKLWAEKIVEDSQGPEGVKKEEENEEYPYPTLGKKGFFKQCVEYVKDRLKTLEAYCVVCDMRHTGAWTPKKPSVCIRSLCLFAFNELNVGRDMTTSIATPVHLLHISELLKQACPEVHKELDVDVVMQEFARDLPPSLQSDQTWEIPIPDSSSLKRFIHRHREIMAKGGQVMPERNMRLLVLPSHTMAFLEKQKKLQQEKRPHLPSAAFHSTPYQDAREGIKNNNFDPNKCGRHDAGYYGRGTYFHCNIPQGGAGNQNTFFALILKGREYSLTYRLGCAKQPGYDSHIAADRMSSGETVIFDQDQMLPVFLFDL